MAWGRKKEGRVIEPPEIPRTVVQQAPAEEKRTCRIVGAEEISEGVFRFILITNISLGEIGSEFEWR